jgi:hypothetical protein
MLSRMGRRENGKELLAVPGRALHFRTTWHGGDDFLLMYRT